MKTTPYMKAMGLTAAALAASLVLFELSDIDISVQDQFYDFPNHQWIVARDNGPARIIFYHGMKIMAVAVGVACGTGLLLSYRIRKLQSARRGLAVMSLSMIFVPLMIAGAKQITNVYTPGQIKRYGGRYPYVKCCQRYPADFIQKKRGKGFPAGHASAGLAIMGAYFAFRRRLWRIIGLTTGLAAGLVMGAYQMVIGQHYLSHLIVSILMAWMILLSIDRIIPFSKENKMKDPCR